MIVKNLIPIPITKHQTKAISHPTSNIQQFTTKPRQFMSFDFSNVKVRGSFVLEKS